MCLNPDKSYIWNGIAFFSPASGYSYYGKVMLRNEFIYFETIAIEITIECTRRKPIVSKTFYMLFVLS